ncbi:MAG TPA: hypothetical protein VK864_20685, partial [Longimicrobiales bacterium]|nr:hypothetical protein [Longimicrobiales bacterium]
LEVVCSSGTYVRALARDLGILLGTGGHLTALRRTRIGHFGIEGAVALHQIADPASRATAAHDLADALRHLPSITVSDEEALQLARGQRIPARPDSRPGEVTLALRDHRVFAVVRRDGDWLRPHKVLALPE